MDYFSQMIGSLLRTTAWRMTPPPPYGLFHIGFTLIGVCVSFLMAKKLRNLSERQHRRFMLGIGIFLMVCELYKQLLHCMVINPGQYSWGDFPFHLCSIPMYLCVILGFLKTSPFEKSLCSFMMLYNFLGGGISFLEPSGLLHSYVTMTIHSLLWHMLLVFVGLYLYFSGRGGLEVKDFKSATVVLLVLCMVAFSLNLLFRELSGGSLNAFFIGPSDSPLIVFHWISQTFGWYICTPIYITTLCFGAWLIHQIMRLCKNRSKRQD